MEELQDSNLVISFLSKNQGHKAAKDLLFETFSSFDEFQLGRYDNLYTEVKLLIPIRFWTSPFFLYQFYVTKVPS